MFGFLCKPLISGTLEEQKMGKSRTYLSAVRQYAFARPSLMPGDVWLLALTLFRIGKNKPHVHIRESA